jgi:hypothetical protein
MRANNVVPGRKVTVSKRLDKSWIVLDSIENSDATRCADLFVRPDDTCGFEEFRRDPEDAGVWTPVAYYSVQSYPSKSEALESAKRAVAWLRP